MPLLRRSTYKKVSKNNLVPGALLVVALGICLAVAADNIPVSKTTVKILGGSYERQTLNQRKRSYTCGSHKAPSTCHRWQTKATLADGKRCTVGGPPADCVIGPYPDPDPNWKTGHRWRVKHQESYRISAQDLEADKGLIVESVNIHKYGLMTQNLDRNVPATIYLTGRVSVKLPEPE